jgi:hypothetical protein
MTTDTQRRCTRIDQLRVLRNMVMAVLALGWILSPVAASAVSYGFDCITSNTPGDCTIGESQLSVDVTDAGSSQVLFTFLNAGPQASSIADVYFDDGALLGIASLLNTVGFVEFSTGASPPELPSANNASPAFVTTVGFSADSDPPVQPMGVNPGESLGILFDLQAGKTFADVIAQLATGELRIGIHVQGFSSGGSESLVNVPEPGTGALLGLGLAAVGATRRRRPAR